MAFVISFISVSGQSSVPNSREPSKTREYHSPARSKVAKTGKKKVTRTKEYEFYERVEKAAHEKKKLLKELYKAKYRDRRYFGHNRIPKRRKADKMRFCDECGIRH